MSQFIPLTGSTRQLLPNSRPTGPVDQSKVASITVRLRSQGNFKDLEKFVLEEANKLPRERQYLSREQLANDHGASAEDLNRLEAFAQRHSLFVTRRSAAQRSITLRGKLSDLLAAFPADVHMYAHPNGAYRGRQGEIQIPNDLAGIVTGIFGFDTRPKSRSYRVAAITQNVPGVANGVSASFYAKRYNFPQKFQNTLLDGTGQTIAIIELGGGFRAADLATYFQKVGSPLPAVSAVAVDHAGNNPTTAGSDDGEVMLDIEVAGTIAPAAKIVVYFAPNNGDQGFVDAISTAIHDTDRKPDVISISWDSSESNIDSQGAQAYHELFVEAAAMGITVCVASGDHGSSDSQDGSGGIQVSHPACDPLVIACGGTQIDTATGTDVVWNDGNGWASGGGISQLFPVPSYQTAANLEPSIATGNPGRGVPDVAMSAVNYFTRIDAYEGPSEGTSAVAPLMAGLVVLLNQAKNKNVGFLNPLLYSKASQGIVKDVTVGNNEINNTVKGYEAKKGWDACTGLGTPIGTALLTIL